MVLESASSPIAVLKLAVVLKKGQTLRIAVFPLPVVLFNSVELPVAVF